MSKRSFFSLQQVAVVTVRRSVTPGTILVECGELQLFLTLSDARALLADLSAVVLHSEPCERLLAEWRTHPQGTFEYRLAEFAVSHTDDEIRAELITYLDEDPADSVPVSCARVLWPTLTSAVTA